MAYSTRTKSLCSKCEKAASFVTCHGCNKDFCYNHIIPHREELNKQMEELATNHDELKQTIIVQQTQPASHPLMKQIDRWEQNSIDKIQQAADDARRELLCIIDKHRTNVTNALTNLTEELTKARNDNDYVETDLKEWTDKLEKLKIDLAAEQVIDFQPYFHDCSLIPKISINDNLTDPLECWIGDIQLTENGRVASHGPTNQIVALHSKHGYSSKRHQFRFTIQQLYFNKNFLLGIVSRRTLMDSKFYKTFATIINNGFGLFNNRFNQPNWMNPYAFQHNPFGGINNSNPCLQNFMSSGYCNHQVQGNALSRIEQKLYIDLNDNLVYFESRDCNINVNDTVELIIDCDQQIIRLKNERTLDERTLDIDITKCPLPWHFFFTLAYPNDCISLC